MMSHTTTPPDGLSRRIPPGAPLPLAIGLQEQAITGAVWRLRELEHRNGNPSRADELHNLIVWFLHRFPEPATETPRGRLVLDCREPNQPE